jgi:hypothetical protein
VGLSQLESFLSASFFAWSPASILYENWLFYTYPATALLALSALTLGSHSYIAWSAFSALLAILALSVALFHVIWFAACISVLWWLVPNHPVGCQ